MTITNNSLGAKLAALVLTVVVSSTMVLGAVAPATAQGNAAMITRTAA